MKKSRHLSLGTRKKPITDLSLKPDIAKDEGKPVNPEELINEFRILAKSGPQIRREKSSF